MNIGQGSSIWYNAVLRGDIENITIGKYSNIQDNSTVHTGKNIPLNSLVMGVSDKIIRQVTEEEIKSVKDNAMEYYKIYKKYIEECSF